MANSVSASNIFGKFAILSIVLGFYFTFLVEGFTGFRGLRNILLLLGSLLFLAKVLIDGRLIIQKDYLIYSLLSLPILIFSLPLWHSLSEVNVYISLITSIIVITSDYTYFKKTLITLSYLLLVLATYEFFTKTYIFVVQRETQSGIISLDPKLFGGFAGIFRAKGLFEGPLALAQYAIGLAFLFKSNLRMVLVACALAFFANGRLGMIVCFLVLGIYFLEKYGVLNLIKSKKGLKIFVGAVLGLILAGSFFIDEKALERLQSVANIQDSGNSARLIYWKKGLDMFREYDLWNQLLGNSGFYRYQVGNSAENGWLMLLLDNGVVGFMYYFTPLLLITYLSFQKKTYHFAYMFLLFVCMMIQTFHLGASANLLYWIIIYSFYLQLKGKQRYEVG
jgi:hypothetical protein